MMADAYEAWAMAPGSLCHKMTSTLGAVISPLLNVNSKTWAVFWTTLIVLSLLLNVKMPNFVWLLPATVNSQLASNVRSMH